MKEAHRNNFTILRLIAAWLILFNHGHIFYAHLPDPLVDRFGFMGSAHIGLAIFFTISGYLVTGSWLRNNNVPHFVMNRALRILPGLGVCILLTALVLGPVVTTLSLEEYYNHPGTWKYLRGMIVFGLKYELPGVFANLPYPNAVNGSLWSLKLEIHMYMMVVIFGLLTLLRPKLVLAWALGCLLVHSFLDTHYFNDGATHLLGFKRSNLHNYTFLGFFFSMGAAHYLFKDKVHITFVGGLVALGIGIIAWYNTPFGPQGLYLVLPYVILSLALATPPLRWNWLQNNDLSYGVYLYAFPIQQTYMYFIGGRYGLEAYIAITTAITLLAAYFSWRFVEHPMLRLKPRG